jgi:colanic acid/amylovoran biosynthesis glycosyltransferase
MRIAYIVSRYPYVSHVFILREVLALRRLRAQIDTFTIRRPDPADLRSEEDRQEDARTYSILPARLLDLVAAHGSALIMRPARYASTFRRAISLRGPGLRSTLWQIFYFGEAALLWRECRRRDIRHIHAHHANVASDVALLASHLGGRGWSWSFTMHGSTEFFDVREHRLAQKTELARFVRCVSEHGRTQLMTHTDPAHWDKLRVVHCGIDPERFPLADRRGHDEELEILTVGRLVPVKGQELLIEAVAELAGRGRPVRLRIVGDGPRREALGRLATQLGIEDRVQFAGAVGQEEIYSHYRDSDVFALTSFAEGLPVVLVEAMATGIPVVAPRITGIPELVQEGASGLLFTPGRMDELAGALLSLGALSKKEREQMGLTGRSRVEAEFALRTTAPQMLSQFDEFLSWTD